MAALVAVIAEPAVEVAALVAVIAELAAEVAMLTAPEQTI